MFPNPFFNMGMPFPGGPGMNAMGGMPDFMAGPGMGGPGMGGPGGGSQGGPGGAHMGGPGMGHQGGGGGGGGGGGRQIVDKSRVCLKFLQTGRCDYGDACKYQHGQNDRRELGHGGPGGGGPGGPQGGRRGGRGGDEDGMRGGRGGARKTRLCEKFMALGHCPYGDKCTFAHGPEELRQFGGPPMGDGPSPQPQQAPVQPAGPMKPPPQSGGPSGDAAAVGASAPSAPGSTAAAATGPSGPTAGPPAPAKSQEVTFVDKVRALCGVLGIGNAAALASEKPLALQTAAMSLRNAAALRENPFADSVERYVAAAAQGQGQLSGGQAGGQGGPQPMALA
ncbi:hypothetical protein HYH03_000303 [Edaphochlamys debaryana]|uniref:C3H1-type domain-containing protein n=1 Tax=Edaphochlamys debaryana TaxID=47281 RepID=A0A835YIF0_9CHLO|nr:hypothetical protein HYH03_000303 [Edaphochlamys debaryana]|eukprot:KAG2501803.1 hypothetical protein HYH03_000303 [Edaphochlamys debaryana]